MLKAVIVLGALGFLAALGLSIVAKKFAFKEDPRLQELLDLLPGANCGACGNAGCSGFAHALFEGKVQIDRCPVMSDDVRRKVAELLGIDFAAAEKRVAMIFCQGTFSRAAKRYTYDGIESCRAAHNILGGDKFCKYGCLGFGDCVKVCPFGASEIKDGVSIVNRDICTGCGLCVEVCPRNLIRLVPESQKVFVLCSSFDKGAVVRKICQVGCIGCRRCVRVCPYDAIAFENNKATIIVEKCTNCGACVSVCPTNAIVDLYPHHPKVQIDADRCDGCGKCKEICPAGAISGELGDVHEVDFTKCLGCGACISACPLGAISYIGESKGGGLDADGVRTDDVA